MKTHYMLNQAVIFAVMLLSLLIMPLRAQQETSAMQQDLRARKISFFNEKLQLTPKEAEKFWPLYNDYQSRMDKIARDRKNLTSYVEKNSAHVSEAEMAEMVEKFLGFQREETKLLETYTARFREFLPDNKVFSIYITETEWKKYLLVLLRENKSQPGLRP